MSDGGDWFKRQETTRRYFNAIEIACPRIVFGDMLSTPGKVCVIKRPRNDNEEK